MHVSKQIRLFAYSAHVHSFKCYESTAVCQRETVAIMLQLREHCAKGWLGKIPVAAIVYGNSQGKQVRFPGTRERGGLVSGPCTLYTLRGGECVLAYEGGLSDSESCQWPWLQPFHDNIGRDRLIIMHYASRRSPVMTALLYCTAASPSMAAIVFLFTVCCFLDRSCKCMRSS